MELSVPTSAVRCLIRAGEALRDDPIGILVPVGGALLAQAAGLVVTRWAWGLGSGAWLATLLGTGALATMLGVPLRSRWIAVAARNDGHDVGPWGRPLPLLGVQVVVWPLALSAGAIPIVPLTLMGLWLGAHGWVALGSVALAVGVCAGTLAALVVRAVFALAPTEAVVGGRSAVDALRVAAGRGVREAAPLALLVLVGDILTGLGSLTCGAVALPGYPITDLALLQRWRASAGGVR